QSEKSCCYPILESDTHHFVVHANTTSHSKKHEDENRPSGETMMRCLFYDGRSALRLVEIAINPRF
ncbi:hypothetical protein D039_0940B, partial [Vibrio parahaemolyticus EKP-028]